VEQLAARGTDLVLVARDGPRLEELATELRSRAGVDVECLVADLLDPAGLEAVASRVAADAQPVDLLVNNAGMGTFGHFAGLDVERELDEVRLNVVALVRLTHAALGAMEARGSGAVVNVSSIAGYQPAPDSATYGATKAFVNSFSHALHEEARRKGVLVMALCPGYTHTEFHERAGLGVSHLPRCSGSRPTRSCASALRDLDRHRSVSIPAINDHRSVSSVSSAERRGVARLVIRRTG
jgi:short-subunit dehydrogenase